MATKAQLERWATAQQINTEEMCVYSHEHFPEHCTTDGQKLCWVFQQNLNELGRGPGFLQG